MRRVILFIVLSMCAPSVFAFNQEVAAISYNPSRLGFYESLVAAEKATLYGGASVEGGASMNIQSDGNATVTLRDNQDTHKCKGSPDGKCVKSDLAHNVDSEGYGLNQIVTIKPAQDTLQDPPITSAAMSGMVQKYNDDDNYFAKSKDGRETYEIEDSSQPSESQGTAVEVYGGKLEATASSYIDSFENAAGTNGATVQRLAVTVSELLVNNGNFNTTESLKLGKIKVVSNASACSNGCKEYVWAERVPDGANEAVQVLAVKIKN